MNLKINFYMFIIFLLFCIGNALMFPMSGVGGSYPPAFLLDMTKWPTKPYILSDCHYTEIIFYSKCSQIQQTTNAV